ncbi:hypothetical protein DXG01_004537 [Tephrocybe rancida]|nr:hypothetical protein DXG01_004537 [Tephrocybe rancida]
MSIAKNDEVLPSEIWTEVFFHVPFKDLLDATLACREFRSAASPRIFKDFAFVPYLVDHELERFALKDADAARELEKLHFFISAPIACFVRSCFLSTRKRSPTGLDKISDDHLLEAFFQHLPRLFNVQNLVFYGITFTSALISRLSVVPNIPSLNLNSCLLPQVPMDPPLPVIHVESVSYEHMAQSSYSSAAHWIHLLDLERLKELEVCQNSKITEQFFRDWATVKPFPNLHTLSLALNPDILPQMLAMLGECPSLYRLTLRTVGSQDEKLLLAATARAPRTILPPVQHYHGPYELLHRFRMDRMVSLSLTNFRSDISFWSDLDPDNVAHELNSSKQYLENIQRFTAQLSFSEPFLLAVGLLLPGVKFLHLSTSSELQNEDASKHLQTVLKAGLPLQLEHLYLRWTLVSRPDESIAETHAFALQLFKQQRSLKHISLRYINIEFTYSGFGGQLIDTLVQKSDPRLEQAMAALRQSGVVSV